MVENRLVESLGSALHSHSQPSVTGEVTLAKTIFLRDSFVFLSSPILPQKDAVMDAQYVQNLHRQQQPGSRRMKSSARISEVRRLIKDPGMHRIRDEQCPE